MPQFATGRGESWGGEEWKGKVQSCAWNVVGDAERHICEVPETWIWGIQHQGSGGKEDEP